MQKKVPVEVSFVRRLLLGILIWMTLLYRAGIMDNQLQKSTDQTSGYENQEKAGQEIRVVLMNSDYSSYYHDSVTINWDGKTITLGSDSTELEDGSFYLDAGKEGFSVPSIERSCGIPEYQGDLTVYAEPDGLLLVNSLPLEAYLKSVLPSEMPASYEREALKAQAVCARTYAGKQMESGRMSIYHADVDDSVACQVYGNICREAMTDRAVEETEGLVLTQDGKLIEAYYFSTSSGQTSTNEIWNGEEILPYLQSVPCPYDAGTPWRKWQTEIPWDQLETRIFELLNMDEIPWKESLEEISLEEISIEDISLEEASLKEAENPEDQETSGTDDDIQLTGLEITKTSASGAATELTVQLEKKENVGDTGSYRTLCGTAEIGGEYQIRTALAPTGCRIQRQNGESVTGGALLPSAYISLAAEDQNHVTVSGRGYGHGVGMSQTAANEMAGSGFTCEEILHYFFHQVLVSSLDGTS